MEDIGQRDYVQTFILNRIESIDRMAVEGVVKIIQFHNITGKHVLIEPFQGRNTAPNFKNAEASRIRKIRKLRPVKFAIPV
jgi:hypothetical protein